MKFPFQHGSDAWLSLLISLAPALPGLNSQLGVSDSSSFWMLVQAMVMVLAVVVLLLVVKGSMFDQFFSVTGHVRRSLHCPSLSLYKTTVSMVFYLFCFHKDAQNRRV